MAPFGVKPPPKVPPARARNIVCGDDAFLIPQEAVVRIGPVNVESCDLPTWADCEGKRTLAGSRARTRRIERGEGAIPIPEETVTHEGRVGGPSRDRPVQVDDFGAERKGPSGNGPVPAPGASKTVITP